MAYKRPTLRESLQIAEETVCGYHWELHTGKDLEGCELGERGREWIARDLPRMEAEVKRLTAILRRYQ